MRLRRVAEHVFLALFMSNQAFIFFRFDHTDTTLTIEVDVNSKSFIASTPVHFQLIPQPGIIARWHLSNLKLLKEQIFVTWIKMLISEEFWNQSEMTFVYLVTND